MDIKHEIGGDMNVLLNPGEVTKLGNGYQCTDMVPVDGVMLDVTVSRDSNLKEALAETSGHDIRVRLPADDELELPVEVSVARTGTAAVFYFGQAGKVILSAVA